MERIIKIWKLAALLLLFPAICFGVNGDTVIEGMPVESLTADKVVRTNSYKVLVSSTVDNSDIMALTNGSGVDALHTHTGASLSGIDISDDTNLAVTAPVVLTGDTLSLTSYALSGTASQVTVTGAGRVTGAATTLSLPATINVDTTGTAANGVYRLAQGSNIATYAHGNFNTLVIEATASIDVTESGGPPAFVLCSGTFNMEDGDTLTLIWDGANWIETARSFAF